DPTTAQALFHQSQDVPLNPNSGYLIAGPGTLNVSAHNLDLGATLGIRSVGPANNPALAALSPSGAAIQVNLSGNLDMFSTTICSLAGGDVRVNAQGAVNVGSSDFSGNDQYARGIFTVAKSDVSVVANGDINVNGSRIAAYDGGNVTVQSLQGNVDAGTGGNGSVSVEKVYVDPATGQVKTYTPTIPGSGILATTFPPSLDPSIPNSPNPVGDILVEAPRGNITASAGGIVQVALNGVDSSAASVKLVAGSTDANGKVLYPGSIDATGSGVIGANVDLEASAGVKGLVFAQQNISISALQNVSVTALAQGNVSVQAGGTVSGSVIGVGSVNVGGTSVDAALLSQNVSTSGNLASSQVGFAAVNVAAGASQSALSSDTQMRTTALNGGNSQNDDQEKRRLAQAANIRLARTVGRVTVILPKQAN
ncbi:MAG: hypothetical protein KGS61_17185, partial [Verrucomicrobia bacterium]|nr:hypothetical protein [Verrucomicrobiota bacterium]